MNNATLLKILPFSILFITILSIMPYTSLPIRNTTIWWLIQLLILYVFWYSKSLFFDQRNTKVMIILQIFLWWNIFSIGRGLFVAESYWAWKGLIGNSMALLLPIVAYVSTNKQIVRSILSFYIRFALPLFFVVIFTLKGQSSYGFYLATIPLLILFVPILTQKWKIILCTIAVLIIVTQLGARSNVIKFTIPFLLLTFYYLRAFISKWLMETVRWIFMFVPIVLFVLAITGIFNVFNMNEYIGGNYTLVSQNSSGELVEENLASDSRTGLYVEVLQTAQKYDSWLIGRSPARGNESELFASLADITGRQERLGNEVGILNIFTWTGIVGVILYWLVFWKASYLAINKSNNIFSKMLGLFIAFRWAYAWVEDINNFTLNYVLLWMMIGMCFSRSFRNMRAFEMKLWVRGIFEKRYAIVGLEINQFKSLNKIKE